MKPLALILFLCLFGFQGYTQCADTFRINKIQQASDGKNDGKIILDVQSNGHYSCELISFKNAARTIVAEKSGNGSGMLTFDNLDNSNFYRVTITFRAENDPLCRTRVVDRIILARNDKQL